MANHHNQGRDKPRDERPKDDQPKGERSKDEPKETRRGELPDFTVEFGDDRNRQILLTTIKRRMRGRYSNSTLFKAGRANIGETAQKLPDIPGMCAKVDFGARTVTFFDPLAKNREPLDRLKAVLEDSPTGISMVNQEYGPVETSTENWEKDPDRFKTMVRELVRLHHEGSCTLQRGQLPTLEEVDEKLPGDYLYDPGWESHYKPRYERDFQDWVTRLNTQAPG